MQVYVNIIRMNPDAAPSWNEKNITVLQNPIGEFNARGGMDLAEYLALQEHLITTHPTLGKEQWEELQTTLPPIELMQDPVTKQHMRVHRFNWPKSDENIDQQTVTVFNLPFSVSIDLKHMVYQHHLLADAIGTPLMVIENPGFGDSDDLTTEQKTALPNGDFGPVAEAMLGIIGRTGAKKINCVGYSMGSDTTAAIAAHAHEHGIKIVDLFVMESPREEEQNLAKLGINFARDAKNLKFTWQHPIDPVLSEVAKLEVGLPKGIFTYGRALYKGGLVSDLERALSTQPNMKLTVARAGSSKINPRKANTNMNKELKAKFPDRKIRQIVVPGESHAYGDSGRRYAHLAQLVLR
jgi:pimeloyl-ACP methyl ester carboxylesterase